MHIIQLNANVGSSSIAKTDTNPTNMLIRLLICKNSCCKIFMSCSSQKVGWQMFRSYFHVNFQTSSKTRTN